MADGSNPTTIDTNASAPHVDEVASAVPPSVAARNVRTRAGRRAGAIGGWALLASVLSAAGTIAVVAVFKTPYPGVVGFGIVGFVSMVGAVLGVVSVVQALRSRQRSLAAPRGSGSHRREPISAFTVGVMISVLANGFMSLMGLALALLSTNSYSRGRQLRSFGRVLLPPVAAGAAWTRDRAAEVASVDEPMRAALARQWRENGRTEHASVAAFARLTLDLMALGAPPSLLAAANRDALDEIRHTELCFAVAREIDGDAQSPGAFPAASTARTLPGTRTLALATLAVDSLVDGALHEGVSARVVARLVKRCEEPRIRAMLKEIAADEGRHAAHGWDVVAYCLAEGGDAVASALLGAARALPREAASSLPAEAADGAWERFGIPGKALEIEEFEKAREDLVRRVDAMVAAMHARAA